MQNVDFLPERVHQERARRRNLFRQIGLLVVALLACGLIWYAWQGRIRKAKAELVLVRDGVRNMERQLEVRRDLEQQLAELMLKKRVDEHLGSRVNALDVIAELESLLPESMVLDELELETIEVRVPIERAAKPRGGPAVARPPGNQKPYDTVRRVRLLLTGLAPTDVDVANFIGQLSASPFFEDVTMSYAKNVEFRCRPAREFQASCYVAR